MTSPTDIAQLRDTALQKLMPIVCRGDDVPVSVTRMYASDGAELTSAMRDALLAKCAAGEYVELNVDMLAYEQRAGVANRKFVRFRDGAIIALGLTGVGTPFLINHDQGDVRARGGTITESSAKKLADGEYAMRQAAKLTAPWAVEMALRELLDRTSIGFRPTGPVLCSACGTEVFTACWHLPGDRLSESTGADGKRAFARDRKGALTVEWIFTSAGLVETSAVNVPAVPAAGIDAVRASLSEALPGEFDEWRPPIQFDASPHTPESQPEEQTMSTTAAPAQASTETELAAKLAADTAAFEARAEARAKVIAEERLANIAAGRQLARKHRLNEADVDKVVGEAATFADAKLKILDMLSARQEPVTQIRNEHSLEVGEEHGEKRIKLASAGILSRVLGEESFAKACQKDRRLKGVVPDDVGRFGRLSLMNIAQELMEERGVSHRALRELDDYDRVKFLMGAPISSHTLGNTTSDFPVIANTVVNVGLRQRYSERQSEWKRAARKENLKNFKTTKYIGAGNFPALLDVDEEGTYQKGTWTESEFDLRLSKGGRMVCWSWELMLADDFNMIARIIADGAQAAVRYEDRMFLTRLLANKMSDGATDFFSVANENISGTTGTPSASVMKAALKTMSRQKGAPGAAGEVDEAGQYAGLRPILWMLGSDDLTDAEQLLGPNYVPTSAANAVTDRMRRLRDGLIEEPVLDDQGTVFSVMFADPNELAAIQWGHLASEDGPVFEQRPGFDTDGIEFKARNTAYCELVEPKAAVKITRS